jgi:2-iminobutanoate/2-iminopropanoate deaminase
MPDGALRAERITTDPEPYKANLISPGFRAGDLLYLSGQVAVGAHQSEIVGIGDFDAQAEQVFENMQTILAAGGSSLEDVVKVTIYLTDIGNLPKVVELRSKHFTPPYPASTMVEVSALAAPEFMIEIEAVAVARGGIVR